MNRPIEPPVETSRSLTKWLSLNDVADFASGGTPSKANAEFWTGPIPWVSAKDMKAYRITTTEDQISPVGLAAGSRLAPKGSTLVLVRGMTLLNDVPICRADRDVAFNQDVKALIPKSGVDGEYLSYAILAAKPQLLAGVDLAGHGTGKLPTDIFKNIRIRVPNEVEQILIAGILGAFDDKIELNRRMSQSLEAIAQAIFKSWFVDFEYSESEGAPADWQEKNLDAAANFLNGLALQKFPPTGDDSLPVIKIAQLRAGHTSGADLAGSNVPPEYVVDTGDVLFSWSGSLEVELWSGGLGALNQHLFKVTSDQYPKWFYYLWTRHHLKEFREIAANKATTMGHIQRKHLSQAKVLVPSPPVVAQLGKALDPIIDMIVAKRVEAGRLAALRDALLPKLLSGELSTAEATNQRSAMIV